MNTDRSTNTGVLLAIALCAPVLASCGERDSTRRTVASADGVEIAYETAGSGEPVLVFVHGWSCDRTYWADQMGHFAGSHRVIAVDLGGHGESGLGRRSWTMESFAEDVRAVVEDVDASDAVLIGHSMGGPVALIAARAMPERVTGVILVDSYTTAPPSPEMGEAFIAQFRSDFEGTTRTIVRTTATWPQRISSTGSSMTLTSN